LLGEFIYQNYRQAVEKIQLDEEKLAILLAQLGMTDADYEGYLRSEHNYLKSLQVEPVEVAHTADYMELLIKLYHVQYVLSIM
jgi:hypothetical protein